MKFSKNIQFISKILEISYIGLMIFLLLNYTIGTEDLIISCLVIAGFILARLSRELVKPKINFTSTHLPLNQKTIESLGKILGISMLLVKTYEEKEDKIIFKTSLLKIDEYKGKYSALLDDRELPENLTIYEYFILNV